MNDLEESVNNSISSFDTRLTQTEEKVESYNNRITTLEQIMPLIKPIFLIILIVLVQ